MSVMPITEDSDVSMFQREVHLHSRKQGFWDQETNPNWEQKVLLIISELCEAMEARRKGEPDAWFDKDRQGKPEGFNFEMADAFIRMLDLAEHEGFDLMAAARLKHAYNLTRPFRHGGKKF